MIEKRRGLRGIAPPVLHAIWVAVATLAGLFARSRLSRVSAEARETRLGFDVLTRIAQHAMLVADARDQIVEWSPGAEDVFGHTATEMLGQPLTRLIAPSDHAALRAEIARTRQGLDHGGRFVLSGQNNDGRPMSLEISLAAWPGSSGQMLGAVLHDVSKQVLAERRLGEVQKNWRDIAENSSDVLLLLDRASTIIFANRGPLSRPLDQVIGSSVAELMPDLGGIIEPALQAVFESGRAYQHEGRITGPDGATHWCWCRFAPQREDGDVVSAVLSISDIGDRIQLQDALQNAKSVAEKANQLKSEFLANMSHEVRTPLNGVVGMVDLLRATSLTPEQASYVATLLEATQALRVIVDDVLDFSKIEAGQLKLENVDLDLLGLAGGAIDMFRHAAVQNDTELCLVVPEEHAPRLLGDPNRIRQVLINLLNNAVKFTRNGGIVVRVRLVDGGATVSARIEIADTGVGISPEAQSVIFQPFAQADGSITRRFGGTGLGLSICRKLIDLMGGDIGFESQVGLGSTFWFELTLGKAQGASPRQDPAESSRLPRNDTRWKILVAEDNAINQKVVSAMLQGLGCSIDVAHDGREALELWQRGSYDLILMDCQMPIMSGFEAASAIRKQEGVGPARIPIVAMTAQAYAQDRERCTRAGMDDHLAKPLTKSELESTIAKWLRLGSMTPLSPAPHPPEAMTLDLAMLERLESDLGDGGKQLLTGLIEAFFVDCPEALERLDEHVEAARWERVAFEAHRLRSSTANLAAANLSLLCEGLEESGQRSEASLAAELMARLHEEFPRARAALTAYASGGAPLTSQHGRE
jgi:PAS domain S-box-containing protein